MELGCCVWFVEDFVYVVRFSFCVLKFIVLWWLCIQFESVFKVLGEVVLVVVSGNVEGVLVEDFENLYVVMLIGIQVELWEFGVRLDFESYLRIVVQMFVCVVVEWCW